MEVSDQALFCVSVCVEGRGAGHINVSLYSWLLWYNNSLSELVDSLLTT